MTWGRGVAATPVVPMFPREPRRRRLATAPTVGHARLGRAHPRRTWSTWSWTVISASGCCCSDRVDCTAWRTWTRSTWKVDMVPGRRGATWTRSRWSGRKRTSSGQYRVEDLDALDVEGRHGARPAWSDVDAVEVEAAANGTSSGLDTARRYTTSGRRAARGLRATWMRFRVCGSRQRRAPVQSMRSIVMAAMPKLQWGGGRFKRNDFLLNRGVEYRSKRASVGENLQKQADAVYDWGDADLIDRIPSGLCPLWYDLDCAPCGAPTDRDFPPPTVGGSLTPAATPQPGTSVPT